MSKGNSRREFLKAASGLLCAGGSATLLPQLNLMGSAMAQAVGSYRALVCIYLSGGSDSFNLLVPRDGTAGAPGARYATYRDARGGINSASNTQGLALDWNALLPVSPVGEPIAYGLHPACADFALNGQTYPGLQTLFNQSRAAFIPNVGTLVRPITKTQYNNNTVPKPPQLYSHNDQENLWNIGRTDINSGEARYGWGGRVAQDGNVAGGNLSNGLSPCISIAGGNRFQVGEHVFPYQMSTSGVTSLSNYSTTGSSNYSPARRAALDALLGMTYSNPFAQEYRAVARRSLDLASVLSSGLAGASGTVATVFPSESLANQMRMVARMIKLSKASLGATRQIFYVRLGGFDTHDTQFVQGQAVTAAGHGNLLLRLSQALGAFWQAMNEIGSQNEVVAFTMSEFGRTLSSNGNGSDHAWGGHQLVMGGPVIGNRLYGRFPGLALNANDDVSQDWSFSRGQYIPTTASDQMAATLGRWMGVPDGALDAIFPNLANFPVRNLGFLSA